MQCPCLKTFFTTSHHCKDKVQVFGGVSYVLHDLTPTFLASSSSTVPNPIDPHANMHLTPFVQTAASVGNALYSHHLNKISAPGKPWMSCPHCSLGTPSPAPMHSGKAPASKQTELPEGSQIVLSYSSLLRPPHLNAIPS